jgi:hypothetical protein
MTAIRQSHGPEAAQVVLGHSELEWLVLFPINQQHDVRLGDRYIKNRWQR